MGFLYMQQELDFPCVWNLAIIGHMLNRQVAGLRILY